MGIILGALGGMGQEMAKIGAANQKALMDEEADTRKATLSSGLALEREKALILFKQNLGAQERADQVKRVDTAAGKIAEDAVTEKRGIVTAGIADKESWTPEQQAAVDQSLEIDKKKIAADPETRIQAAIGTGDIAPKDAATINRDERRLDATERATAARERQAEMRDATQRYIADLRDKQQSARLEALVARMGKDKDGTKEALSFLEGARKELSSEEQTVRQLYQAELRQADKYDPEAQKAIKEQYEPKLAEIANRRKEIQADYDAVRTRVGLPERAPAKPEPTKAPSALPKLPAGAKKIGTSGGKAVYETPDGKRFIEN